MWLPYPPCQEAPFLQRRGRLAWRRGAAASLASTEDQSAIEASKYNVVGRPADGDIDLSGLDDGLPPYRMATAKAASY